MNRRELIGMASVGAIAVALIGVRVTSRGSSETSKARINFTDAEWRTRLGPERYHILREAGTEYPGSSPLVKEHRKGTFACAGCDQALFLSAAKYDSHTGWPSFWDVLPNATTRMLDFTIARPRTELRCSACDSHLGHVFDDGPKPTGLRYCMNGLALSFHPVAA